MKEEVLQSPEVGEEYCNRPNRKPDVVKKGKLIGWNEEGVYQFAAQVPRPDLQQEVLVKKKDLKVAKTGGEKESTIILTAKVDADAADPYGALLAQCVTELGPKAKKTPKVQIANYLLDEEGVVKAWLRKKEKKLVIFMELNSNQNKELIYKDFSEIQTKIYKAIAANKL